MEQQKTSIKRPPLPLVLTANDLLEGGVVYYDGAGWTRGIDDALVAHDEAGALVLDAALAASEPRVVEPFLAPVAADAEGRVSPVHYREQIRISGPTFHRDHGFGRTGAL